MTPKYLRLSNILKEQVRISLANGEDKLPTEKSLCEKYGVSRQTVREALAILEKENLILKKQGSGIYINYPANSGRDKRIALLLAADNEYIFPSIIKSLRIQFEKSGYVMDVLLHDGDYSIERSLLMEVAQKKYSGIIVQPIRSSLPGPNAELYETLRDSGCKVLFLWGLHPNMSSFPCVRADDVFGGYIAAKHLINNGHLNISLLMNRDDITGLNRYSGLLMAISDSGIPIKNNTAYWYFDEDINALHSFHDLTFLETFIHSLSGSTAVVCHNDEVAYWLIKELEKSGLKVPEDISVVSFDNSYLSDFASSHITSLSHNKGEFEKQVCEYMLNLINGKEYSLSNLSWKLIKRSSDSSI